MRALALGIAGTLLLASMAAQAAPAKKKQATKAASADIELELDLAPPAGGDDLDLDLPPAPPPASPAPAAPAPAPAPVPTEPPPLEAAVPEEPVAEAYTGPRFRITPITGFGWTGESWQAAATPVFGGALKAEYAFNRDATLALGVGDHFYRRSYLTTLPALGGGSAALEVSEQKVATDLLFSYELLPLFGVENRTVTLAATAGPSFRFLLNDTSRTIAGGMAVGGRAGFAPSEQLDFEVGGFWAWNLVGRTDGVVSAHGGPKAISALEAAVGLHLAPKTRFRIGYGGEVLTLASSYRLFHTLSFAFDVRL